MNLAILVTDYNRDHLAAFIARASELQTSPVNGAVLLVHSAFNPDADELLAPLASIFKVSARLPIQINPQLSADGQASMLFSRFLLNAYTSYPGPWLVVDDFALPVVPDFMQEAERQHMAGGDTMSGRGTTGPGWLLPVGPVTISLPAKSIAFLRFAGAESWRSAGRYHFARSRFAMVESADYLFTISLKEPVEMPDLPAKPEPEPNPIPLSAEELLALPRAELIQMVATRSGRQPHPSTGAARLVSILTEEVTK